MGIEQIIGLSMSKNAYMWLEEQHERITGARIPLMSERIPEVENEKTLTGVSDKQEFE